MASHNFSYKEVNYSVYVTQQKDGRWDGTLARIRATMQHPRRRTGYEAVGWSSRSAYLRLVASLAIQLPKKTGFMPEVLVGRPTWDDPLDAGP